MPQLLVYLFVWHLPKMSCHYQLHVQVSHCETSLAGWEQVRLHSLDFSGRLQTERSAGVGSPFVTLIMSVFAFKAHCETWALFPAHATKSRIASFYAQMLTLCCLRIWASLSCNKAVHKHGHLWNVVYIQSLRIEWILNTLEKDSLDFVFQYGYRLSKNCLPM